MKKFISGNGLIALLFLLSQAIPVLADVTVKEKTKTTFHGTFGMMMNKMSQAGNEVQTTTFVQGNYSRSENPNSISIIDLEKERFININPKKKQYTILTFADMKKQMDETAKMFQKEGTKVNEGTKPEPPTWEADVKVDRTGQKAVINGINAEELVLTITLKQKGFALEDSGGTIITADQWLADKVPGYDELQAFNKRMAEKITFALGGDMSTGMAGIFRGYPQVQVGFEKLGKEMEKMGKVSVRANVTVETVKGKKQLPNEQPEDSESTGAPNVNKMLGGFAKKMVKKDSAAGGRSSFMDTFREIQRVSSQSLDATLFEIPAGYKEVKWKQE